MRRPAPDEGSVDEVLQFALAGHSGTSDGCRAVSQTLDRGRQTEYRSIAQRKHSSDRLPQMHVTTGLAMRRTLAPDQPELGTGPGTMSSLCWSSLCRQWMVDQ